MNCLRPPSRNWLLFGSETEPVPLLPLRAGPLHLLYEPASGFVRRVCLGQHEVLRGIYTAVRDRNWGTVPGTLRETRREVAADSFHFALSSEHRRGDLHFIWQGSIRGQPDGVLRYDFDGVARTTFLRNRIGFWVLHPMRECVGVAARQKRIDGGVVACRFPDTIEPQIPGQNSFRNLSAVAHEIAPGLWAELQLDGEVFEMEDHRNWTDASFKTYCTPLALPFPTEIQAGTRIRQSVTLRLSGSVPGVAAARVELAERQREPITVSLPEAPATRCPRFGLGMASHGDALTGTEIARLRALRLGHLRADVRLSAPDWPAVWRRAAREAEQLGVGLELVLHLPRDADGDLTALRRHLQTRQAGLVRVLALREGEPATTLETLRWARQALAGSEVPVGAGSDANFCELNRDQALGRAAPAEADFVFWALNPQVHSFDHLSLMETLEAQGETVRTARTFADGKPLVISPVTLKPRFNAVATGPPLPVPAGELPPPVDPRQLSLFAAAWTLGSLAVLANANAESVTLYETTGWRGVMERERGSPLPEKFPSLPGGVFPVFHVFADLAGCGSHAPTHISAPSRIAALSVFDGEGRRRVLLGNLTPQMQRVHLFTSAPAVVVRVLAEDNVLCAMRDPEQFRARVGERFAPRAGILELSLPPYAVACLGDVLQLEDNGSPSSQSTSATPKP